MTTTAVVIARGGSTRLPNKNMLQFYGRPLVAHKVWQLKQCKSIDDVVVGSDSEEILEAAFLAGANLIRRAPEFCDEKSRSWNDVIHDMVSKIHATTIVWAHCTNPCIFPATYERAIRCYNTSDGDSLVSVSEIRSHVWWNGRPLNFDPYGKPHEVAAKLPPVYHQNGGIFIMRRELMELSHYVYGNCPELFVIPPGEDTDVDTQDDLDRAIEWYGRKCTTEKVA